MLKQLLVCVMDDDESGVIDGKVLFCPYALFDCLKKLSLTKTYINSHKCIFKVNKITHLTEIYMIEGTYANKVIRNVDNLIRKEPQSIEKLAHCMPQFGMCLESMFYLDIITCNKDIGILIRGIRSLAATIDLFNGSTITTGTSVKHEYIHQSLSKFIRILEQITI